MELSEIRRQIDETDAQLLPLLLNRMHLCAQAGLAKHESGQGISHPQREREILTNVRQQSGKLAPYTEEMYQTLFDLSKKYQTELIAALDKRYLLIGRPLAQSISPRLHALFGNESYGKLPLNEDELKDFFAKRRFDGLNVTIPYKQVVIPYLDALSDRAAEIGAVNTVVCRANGTLYGDNTDCDGFFYLLDRLGIDVRGRKALVLGTGATSRTAAYCLKKRGVAKILFVSRHGECNYETCYQQKDTLLIVNTTPVGMMPDIWTSPVDIARFPCLEGVVDVVANPLKTALVEAAQHLGIPAGGGLPMLVEQARAAEELFMGHDIAKEESNKTLRKTIAEQTNLVFIGMPGSGKTTLGMTVARILGRSFFDTDKMVEDRTGRTVQRIFETEGEATFRALESEAVAQACSGNGRVISLGGGAILNEKNRRAAAANGRIYLIVRAHESLTRRGRPLSSSTNGLTAMLKERGPIYQSLCDRMINNATSKTQAVREITEDFYAHFGN